MKLREGFHGLLLLGGNSITEGSRAAQLGGAEGGHNPTAASYGRPLSHSPAPTSGGTIQAGDHTRHIARTDMRTTLGLSLVLALTTLLAAGCGETTSTPPDEDTTGTTETDADADADTETEDSGTPEDTDTPEETPDEEGSIQDYTDDMYLTATYVIQDTVAWEDLTFFLGIGYQDSTVVIENVEVFVYDLLEPMEDSGETVTVGYTGADGDTFTVEEAIWSWDAGFNPSSLEFDVVVTDPDDILIGWFMFETDCVDDDAQYCFVSYIGSVQIQDGELVVVEDGE